LSNPAVFITVGSIGDAWAFRFFDTSGRPQDFTGVTGVRFSARFRGSTVGKVVDQAAEVGNGTYTLPDGSSQTFTPADGVLIYQPSAQDADTDGQLIGQFAFQKGGKPVINPGLGYVEIIIQAAV
jgi:hypothetical protein